jgi:protein MAK11
LKGHKGRVNSIDPHPEGRVCLSVGKDKNLRMWDLVAGKSVATLKLGTEGDVVRWNAVGTKFGVITANTLTVYGIVSLIFSSETSFRLAQLTLARSHFQDMSIHHTLTAPSRFHDLQFCILPSSPSKEFLLVACEDGKVRVFDISNPKPVKVGQEEDEEEFENREKMEVCAELVGHSNR